MIDYENSLFFLDVRKLISHGYRTRRPKKSWKSSRGILRLNLYLILHSLPYNYWETRYCQHSFYIYNLASNASSYDKQRLDILKYGPRSFSVHRPINNLPFSINSCSIPWIRYFWKVVSRLFLSFWYRFVCIMSLFSH